MDRYKSTRSKNIPLVFWPTKTVSTMTNKHHSSDPNRMNCDVYMVMVVFTIRWCKI